MCLRFSTGGGAGAQGAAEGQRGAAEEASRGKESFTIFQKWVK